MQQRLYVAQRNSYQPPIDCVLWMINLVCIYSFFPEKGSPCVAQAGHKGSSYLSPWDGWLIHRVQFMSTS